MCQATGQCNGVTVVSKINIDLSSRSFSFGEGVAETVVKHIKSQVNSHKSRQVLRRKGFEAMGPFGRGT